MHQSTIRKNILVVTTKSLPRVLVLLTANRSGGQKVMLGATLVVIY